MVGAMGMDLDRAEFYNRELDFVMSRAYGPGRYDRAYEEEGVDYPLGHVRWTEGRNLGAFAQLIADGKVDVGTLVTAEESVERAEDAYTHVLSGGPESLAALLTYDHAEPASPPARTLRLRAGASATGRIRVAVVGAGVFARAVHLPNLKGSPLFDVRAVVDSKGTIAQRSATDMDAPYATTDFHEALSDPQVDAIFIATRHNLHAEMAIAAARAGKHVFVEKPLGITTAECESVVQAVEEAGTLLTVGFNRRFAPTLEALKDGLAGAAGPNMVTYRVNAGPLPPTHWLLDPAIGGGRLVGEGCHFFDFVRWLVGEEPTRLSAQAVAGTNDSVPQDFVVTLSFPNGSVGTVIYSGMGNPSFSKERVEVLAGGGVAVMEDFTSLTLHGLPGKAVRSRTGQKGYRAHLANFGAAVRGDAPLGITAQDGLRATLIAEKALEAIRGNGAVDLQAGG
jgi:predicted dehydrogenase